MMYVCLSYTWLHLNGDNWIVFEYFTASIVDFMVANIRLLAPLTRLQYTQFATIKSPIDAVQFSNTIQLSPNYKKSLIDCPILYSRQYKYAHVHTTHFFLFLSGIFSRKCLSVILVNYLCSCLTTLTCWFLCA